MLEERVMNLEVKLRDLLNLLVAKGAIPNPALRPPEPPSGQLPTDAPEKQQAKK